MKLLKSNSKILALFTYYYGGSIMDKFIHMVKRVFLGILSFFVKVPKQAGELVVTGEDKVEIPLLHNNKPKRVIVKFKDHCVIVPCSPSHYDELDWEIKHDHDKNSYILVILWKVSGVRIIKWSVF